MDYRTLSAKVPRNEYTLFKTYCEKKGVSPSYLIRDLILKEIDIAVPNTIAGRNTITYNKESDSFSWFIELDSGITIEVLKNISPDFIENLRNSFSAGLEEREIAIQKKRKNSVPIPGNIMRRDNV